MEPSKALESHKGWSHTAKLKALRSQEALEENTDFQGPHNQGKNLFCSF